MAKVLQKTKGQRLVTEEYLDSRLDLGLGTFKGEILQEMKGEMREEIREHTVEILQGVDKILTRFDAAEKDHAAHSVLHGRITDDLHGHEARIKKLEVRV